MYIHDRIAELPGRGAVPANTTVVLKKAIDDATVQTSATDAKGFVTFQANGSPGPTYLEVSIGAETRIRHGSVQSQMGPWYAGELGSFLQNVRNGVNRFEDDALQVVPGTGLTVKVLPGSCIAEGVLAKWYTEDPVNLATNSSGVTRWDAVGITIWVTGAEAGRSEIRVVSGGTTTITDAQINAATPADAMMVVLAHVRVQSGAAVIQASDITDVRAYASPLEANMVETTHLKDGVITSAKLATDSVTGAKISDNAIEAHHIAPNAVTASQIAAGGVNTSELADNSVTAAKIAAGAVGASEIADGSITSTELSSALKKGIGGSKTTTLIDMFPATHKLRSGAAPHYIRTGPGYNYFSQSTMQPNTPLHRFDADTVRVDGIDWYFCYVQWRGFGWVGWLSGEFVTV